MLLKLPTSSLRWKIGLFVSLLIGLSLVIISVVFVLSEKSAAESDIKNEARVFAESTANQIYRDYSSFYTHPLEGDFENFKTRTTERLKLNPDIQRVSLVSINGTMLFDSEEFVSGKYNGATARKISEEKLLELVMEDEIAFGEYSSNLTPDSLVVSVPIEEIGGGHLLSMIYHVSNNSLTARLNEVYRQIIQTVLPLMLGGILLSVLFSGQIIKPIVNLTNAARRLSEGKFDVEVNTKSSDEIGVLSKTFTQMAVRLKESYENIATQHARFQASISGLTIGYVMTGKDNEILFINSAAETLLTLSSPTAKHAKNAIDTSELLGKITLDFIQESLGKNVPILKHIEKSKKEKINILLKDIQYKVLYLNLYITPIIPDDSHESIGAVLLIEDITEQKIVERSREEFFSIASHELRTPLTAIRGNTSLIQQYFSDEIKNPEVLNMVADIHESSLRLIDIVNDFLDVSRLEQGKMQYQSEAFDIVSLCRDVFKEYEVTGSRRKLYFNVDAPKTPLPLVFSDKTRLRQILVNLLGNGVKYTQEGGITISFEKRENKIKIFMKDTGKGIDEQNKKLLFRKFQQAQTNILTRDNTKGTGLGLYISKLMINNMGGQIELEDSKVGVGSTFSITVPTATSGQITATKEVSADPNKQQYQKGLS